MIYSFSAKVACANGSCQARFVALNVLGRLYTGLPDWTVQMNAYTVVLCRHES